MIELNDFEVNAAGKDMSEVTCGGETVAYMDFNKKGISVNSVFTESSKQFKSSEEAMAWIKKITTKFAKNIIRK